MMIVTIQNHKENVKYPFVVDGKMLFKPKGIHSQYDTNAFARISI